MCHRYEEEEGHHNLYPVIVASGLEPDAILLSCPPFFSGVCCGTEPSRELTRLAPRQDIQNYVVLTRAALHGKSAGRADDHLGMLERSGGMPDPALYDFVLKQAPVQETLPVPTISL